MFFCRFLLISFMHYVTYVSYFRTLFYISYKVLLCLHLLSYLRPPRPFLGLKSGSLLLLVSDPELHVSSSSSTEPLLGLLVISSSSVPSELNTITSGDSTMLIILLMLSKSSEFSVSLSPHTSYPASPAHMSSSSAW
uniref:Uncharacterized protein n=1 Tax=Opuntia streptacantha TaxID=393608 RepID=A0A7C9DGL6_OPUST